MGFMERRILAADLDDRRFVMEATSAITLQQASIEERTFRLQGNQYLNLREAAGWTVCSLEGELWITQDGDVRDIVLEAGDSFVLDRNDAALLSNLRGRGEVRFSLIYGSQRALPFASPAALRQSLA